MNEPKPTGPVFVGETFPVSEMRRLAEMNINFIKTAKVDDVAELPVAICQSERVVYDPVDRIVMLRCKKVVRPYCSSEEVLVMCPRYPQGLFPGVRAGAMPVLAARDMQPLPKQKRGWKRRWQRGWQR